MSALTLSSSSATSLRADAVVVGVAAGGAKGDGRGGKNAKSTKGTKGAKGAKGAKGTAEAPVVAPGGEAVDEAFGGRLGAMLKTLGAAGSEGEITKLPAPDGVKASFVLAVGLGTAPAKDEGWPAERLRRAAGAAARALAGSAKAVFALPAADPGSVAAIAEGALLGAYAFTVYRGGEEGADRPDAPLAEIVLAQARPRDKEQKAAVARAEVLAAEVHRARDLVNTPPNDLGPEDFAAAARAAAAEHGLAVEVMDEKALAEGGYGGILGVGRGSQKPPRLVRLSWTHPKARGALALVGKGITYDSGGISLKPAGHNETMKCDMSGAAAVFAAVVGAARLGLRVNVTGWLALAENMPSGSATRPGDVLRMYSGKTVEVLNTDAEGRLVLADALTRAGEESPDALVDVATLTGAMVVALGHRTFGIMANEDGFRDVLHETAEATGEQSWPLPLPGELRKSIDSPVADMANVGERMGGGLLAGLFLKEYVAEGTPWAHLDIAGPAFNEGAPFGYTPKGGTGAAVRTLVGLAERLAAGEALTS